MSVFSQQKRSRSRYFPAGNDREREVLFQLIQYVSIPVPSTSRSFPLFDREVQPLVFTGVFEHFPVPGFP